jgi:hypothetical protein
MHPPPRAVPRLAMRSMSCWAETCWATIRSVAAVAAAAGVVRDAAATIAAGIRAAIRAGIAVLARVVGPVVGKVVDKAADRVVGARPVALGPRVRRSPDMQS